MPVPISPARISTLLRTTQATNIINQQQQQLIEVQNQLASGKRLNVASDDPGDAALALQLRKTLDLRETYLGNLRQAGNTLSEVDQTLGDLSTLITEAQSIASANVSSTVTAEQRTAAASVISSLQTQILSLANKSINGMHIFGGDRSNTEPFTNETGGIRFVGSRAPLANVMDEGYSLEFMVDADSVFGALSTRVQGSEDLTPAITANTLISDLRGAGGDGVQRGSIRVGNGTDTALVDLSNASTIDDVMRAIDNAGIGGIMASIAPNGLGLQLTGNPTDNITVQDVGGGSTALDLGIRQNSGQGAGLSVDGQSVQARVTLLTPLAQLKAGAGFDTTNGVTITNGQNSATLTFDDVTTIEGMLNKINGAGVGVRAEINNAGDGINILNEIQGSLMSIAENGGTTAADLGVRSFHAQSLINDLNLGAGVTTVDGNDFRVTRGDGTTFEVDVDGLDSIQDVIDAINTASGDARVTASFAATGNGILLTDTTGDPQVSNLNSSAAATNLGIEGTGSAGTLQGDDVHAVQTTGVFASMLRLQRALNDNDQIEITRAAEAMQEDLDRVIGVHGMVGARVQEVEARQDRLEEQNIATTTLLSVIEDTDFTEAITRFQTLQTSLQASLQTSGTILNLSLLDFIR